MNSQTTRAERLIALADALERSSRAQGTCPPPRVRVMRVIDFLGGASVGDIAHADGASQSGTTHHIAYLVEHNLARRVEAPWDRRSGIVTLTPEGRRYLAECEQELLSHAHTDAPLQPTDQDVVDRSITLLEHQLRITTRHATSKDPTT